MIIIPAIDVRGGNVVRLLKGDYGRETQYSEDPVIVAQRWFLEGAEMLHIVDLDGARSGSPANLEIIQKIAALVTVPVQMGGGIRNADTVADVIGSGLQRIVLGTKALDTSLVRDLVTCFGQEAIVVGVDAENGIVKTEGWRTDAGVSVEELCRRIIPCGVRNIVFTDISRDGMLTGPNITSLQKVLAFSQLNVIASGGIGSLEDIERLAALKAENLYGVIVGKALYEKRFTIAEANAVVKK